MNQPKYMMLALMIISLIAFTIYFSHLAESQTPQGTVSSLMSYQGILTDANGKPITAMTNVTFSIYNSDTSQIALWQESQAITPASNGAFSVQLGGVTPFPADLFKNNATLFLGIKVGSDAEMTPRQKITSGAYAFAAEIAAPRSHTHTVTDIGGFGVAVSVGNVNAAGSAATFARSDHVHQGVHSLATSGNPQLSGDVILAAGANILLTQSGQSITIEATTATTSAAITDFTNSQHNHQNAAGGGVLAAAAIASGELPDARIADTLTITGGNVAAAILSGNVPVANLGNALVLAAAASQTVTYGAAGVQTILKMAASPSAAPLAIKDSAGADVFVVSTAGAITTGSVPADRISGELTDAQIGNTLTLSDFTNAAHTHQNAAGGGQLDHGLALTGLADDDHTQYALLAGRAGGQTLIGGTAASNDLTLQSTSNATRGNVVASDDIRLVSGKRIKTSTSANDTLILSAFSTGSGSYTDLVTLTAGGTPSVTIVKPTIADFTNANHSHQDAAGGGKLDHGLALTGLADDDHTQYALLAGRTGGQTLVGGNAASENLVLRSTANATKGNVVLADDGGKVGIGTTAPAGTVEIETSGNSSLVVHSRTASPTADFAILDVQTGSAASGTSKFKVDSEGDVTLNSVTGLSGTLSLSAASGGNNGITLNTVGSGVVKVDSPLSTGDINVFVVETNVTLTDSVKFKVDSDGDVALNSITANAALTITATGASGSVTISASADGNNNITLNTGGTGALKLDSPTASADTNVLIIETDVGTTSNKFKIDSDGDVTLNSVTGLTSLTLSTSTVGNNSITMKPSGSGSIKVDSSVSSSDVNLFIVESNVGGADNPKFRVDSDGDVFADGAISAAGSITANSTCADIAERYETTESVEPGDVLALDENSDGLMLKKATSRDLSIIGVVSTKPGITLADYKGLIIGDVDPVERNSPAIALAGRVPVKVVGPVSRGELLVPSELPGIATAYIGGATPQAIIGIALENYDGEDGIGKVMMFIKNGFVLPVAVKERSFMGGK